jgi:hypothetical protein
MLDNFPKIYSIVKIISVVAIHPGQGKKQNLCGEAMGRGGREGEGKDSNQMSKHRTFRIVNITGKKTVKLLPKKMNFSLGSC